MNVKICLALSIFISIISTASSAPFIGSFFEMLNGFFGKNDIIEVYTSGNFSSNPDDSIDKAMMPQCYCGKSVYYNDIFGDDMSSSAGDSDEDRIVGGSQIIHYYDAPWAAQLLLNRKFQCTGSVINDLYVLSAAHCLYSLTGVYPYDYSRFSVLLDTSFKESSGYLYGVAGYLFPYSYYRARENGIFDDLTGDIVIIKLTQRINFMNSAIRPACLPPLPFWFSYNQYVGKISGWGREGDSFPNPSNVLKQGNLQAYTKSACLQKVDPNHIDTTKIKNGMMCGFPVSSTPAGICLGDSGGPFTINVYGYEFQIAISSFIFGTCALEPNKPNVFTDLTAYANFVRSNTQDAYYCSEPWF